MALEGFRGAAERVYVYPLTDVSHQTFFVATIIIDSPLGGREVQHRMKDQQVRAGLRGHVGCCLYLSLSLIRYNHFIPIVGVGKRGEY